MGVRGLIIQKKKCASPTLKKSGDSHNLTRLFSSNQRLRAYQEPASATPAAWGYCAISHLRCLTGNGIVPPLGCKVTQSRVKREKAVSLIDDNINRIASALG